MLLVEELLPPAPKIGLVVKPQHVHWQVGKYVEKFSIGPGGVGKSKIWVPSRENEQHNLLLDHLFTSLAPAGANGGFLPQSVRAHVGTGSTAPSASQTGLVSPLVNTNFIPSGESDSYTLVSDGVYDIRRVKEFTEAQVGGQNLTEWGFGRTTTNSLMCRELFRDSGGNPITLTLASDQRLRLIYTYRITYTPVTPQAVAPNIAGLGVRTGQFMITRARNRYEFNSNSDNYAGLGFWNSQMGGVVLDGGDLLMMETLVRGAGINYAALVGVASTQAASTNYNDTGTYSISPTQSPVGLNLKTNVGRSRKFDMVFTNNNFNFLIRTLGLAIYATATTIGSAHFTAKLIFDAGQEINKTNLYKLVMNDWEITW